MAEDVPEAPFEADTVAATDFSGSVFGAFPLAPFADPEGLLEDSSLAAGAEVFFFTKPSSLFLDELMLPILLSQDFESEAFAGGACKYRNRQSLLTTHIETTIKNTPSLTSERISVAFTFSFLAGGSDDFSA